MKLRRRRGYINQIAQNKHTSNNSTGDTGARFGELYRAPRTFPITTSTIKFANFEVSTWNFNKRCGLLNFSALVFFSVHSKKRAPQKRESTFQRRWKCYAVYAINLYITNSLGKNSLTQIKENYKWGVTEGPAKSARGGKRLKTWGVCF